MTFTERLFGYPLEAVESEVVESEAVESVPLSSRSSSSSKYISRHFPFPVKTWRQAEVQ